MLNAGGELTGSWRHAVQGLRQGCVPYLSDRQIYVLPWTATQRTCLYHLKVAKTLPTYEILMMGITKFLKCGVCKNNQTYEGWHLLL